jgi:hypothetical protein
MEANSAFYKMLSAMNEPVIRWILISRSETVWREDKVVVVVVYQMRCSSVTLSITTASYSGLHSFSPVRGPTVLTLLQGVVMKLLV